MNGLKMNLLEALRSDSEGLYLSGLLYVRTKGPFPAQIVLKAGRKPNCCHSFVVDSDSCEGPA
jgi:hypothetical protein